MQDESPAAASSSASSSSSSAAPAALELDASDLRVPIFTLTQRHVADASFSYKFLVSRLCGVLDVRKPKADGGAYTSKELKPWKKLVQQLVAESVTELDANAERELRAEVLPGHVREVVDGLRAADAEVTRTAVVDVLAEKLRLAPAHLHDHGETIDMLVKQAMGAKAGSAAAAAAAAAEASAEPDFDLEEIAKSIDDHVATVLEEDEAAGATLGKLRTALEKRLGLPKKALKPLKQQILAAATKILTGGDDDADDEEPEPEPEPEPEVDEEPEPDHSSDEDYEEPSTRAPARKRRQRRGATGSRAKRSRAKQAAPKVKRGVNAQGVQLDPRTRLASKGFKVVENFSAELKKVDLTSAELQLQLVHAPDKPYFLWACWGQTVNAFSLRQFGERADAELAFARLYEQKTGTAWTGAPLGDKPALGKYSAASMPSGQMDWLDDVAGLRDVLELLSDAEAARQVAGEQSIGRGEAAQVNSKLRRLRAMLAADEPADEDELKNVREAIQHALLSATLKLDTPDDVRRAADVFQFRMQGAHALGLINRCDQRLSLWPAPARYLGALGGSLDGMPASDPRRELISQSLFSGLALEHVLTVSLPQRETRFMAFEHLTRAALWSTEVVPASVLSHLAVESDKVAVARPLHVGGAAFVDSLDAKQLRALDRREDKPERYVLMLCDVAIGETQPAKAQHEQIEVMNHSLAIGSADRTKLLEDSSLVGAPVQVPTALPAEFVGEDDTEQCTYVVRDRDQWVPRFVAVVRVEE